MIYSKTHELSLTRQLISRRLSLSPPFYMCVSSFISTVSSVSRFFSSQLEYHSARVSIYTFHVRLLFGMLFVYS